MLFENFTDAESALLWGAFLIALVMGAVVNKTNFCTMGAVSDWVNMGDTGRFRAWLLAIAVAILGVVGLEYFGFVNPGNAFPPYRAGQLIWAENLLGGLLFGIGMTLASGCGNKCLIRIGGGNIKSILVFVVIAICAYFMLNPFPGTDKTLYSVLFYPWTNPTSASLTTGQDLGSVIGNAVGTDFGTTRTVIGLILVALMLWFVFKSADFRRSFDNKLAGVAVAALGSSLAFITQTISAMSLKTVLVAILVITALIVVPTAVSAYARLSRRDLSAMLEGAGWGLNSRMKLTPQQANNFTRRPSRQDGS